MYGVPEPRLVADPTITVEMLEADIEEWLQHCTSRDILALLSQARRWCSDRLSPASCTLGIMSIAKLLYICLQRMPNAVLPRSLFTTALMKVHERQPIYVGERTLLNVADEATSIGKMCSFEGPTWALC